MGGGQKNYDLMYYVKGAASGGICCSVTHGALCPVDVVKTRIQLDPVTYNKGMIGGFRQIIAAEVCQLQTHAMCCSLFVTSLSHR